MKQKPSIPASVEWALAQLEAAGYQGYLVGGCVRDRLMGRLPHDYDITTSALPAQCVAVFGRERVVETGLKHGTVTLQTPEGGIEITTYRQDGVYSDHRHPDRVVFTPSLTEDLARRDFTVNAMAMDRRGLVVDPFGGRADLQAGLLRCVGDPLRRFEEDALRILRGLRFAARFGFTVEEETARAMITRSPLLAYIAAERILQECNGLLQGAFCPAVLRSHSRVVLAVLPELAEVELDRACARLQKLSTEPVLRWAGLLADCSPRQAAAVLQRLKAPNALCRQVPALVEAFAVPCAPQRVAVHRRMVQMGEASFGALLALWQADGRSVEALQAQRRALLDEGACLSLKDLAVNGRDVMALGITGAEVGQALERLLDRVIDGTLPNQRDLLLKTIKP